MNTQLKYLIRHVAAARAELDEIHTALETMAAEAVAEARDCGEEE